jgi:uncharacterized protein (DUF983 family)
MRSMSLLDFDEENNEDLPCVLVLTVVLWVVVGTTVLLCSQYVGLYSISSWSSRFCSSP